MGSDESASAVQAMPLKEDNAGAERPNVACNCGYCQWLRDRREATHRAAEPSMTLDEVIARASQKLSNRYKDRR
jgi:hypothetical protein